MTHKEQDDLDKAVITSMRQAVRKLYRARRKAGEPVYVLKNGRVAKVMLGPKRTKA